jgi:Fe-Mn family superoxide dismutase
MSNIDLSETDLQKIVSESLSKSLSKHGVAPAESTKLSEAYVVDTKTYKLTTDNLSQKTKDGHVQLYQDYVRVANTVSAELDSTNKSDANSSHSQFRSLKLDESYNLNAKWLHELYFSNCFDPNSEIFMDSQAYIRLQRDFGTFENWQKDFMACAMSAGEGWAVTGWHHYLKRYVNTIVSHHSGDVMMGLYPVIVLDVWSHAYHRDYVVDRKSYIVAMMRELNWNTIENRFKMCERMAEVMK